MTRGWTTATVFFVTHPEVVIDPAVPVPDWGLSPRGRERIAAFCSRPLLDGVTDVFCSGERKAVDCAEALRTHRGLPFTVEAGLGENDRSSTGYIAPPRFWEIVAAFFADPERSVFGWETAANAQRRIGNAVRRCLADRAGRGDAVVVSHGGVGTLLLCELLGEQISLARGQPIAGGGCFFAFEAETLRALHGWRDIGPEQDAPCPGTPRRQ